MSDFGMGLSDGEIKVLFGYFDGNRNNLIEYDEFLRAIRGPMNEARKHVVKKAFLIMDKDGNGYLDYNDLVGVYSGKFHPDVLSKKKTEKQILEEFLETFETAHNVRHNDAPDHVVTAEEWEEYYNNVSASIDRDDYFAVMMNNAWNLDGKRVSKGGWSNGTSESQAAGSFHASKGLDGKLKNEPRAANKAAHESKE